MKKNISIIGGGPAALAFCSFIDTQKYDVTIYEKNNACGRKFMVAGKGGFNLSHAEELHQFIQRYTPCSFLADSLKAFSNEDLRTWLNEIGIPTYVGSSKRVYPKEGIKPIAVLQAILNLLEQKKVSIITKTNWRGWKNNSRLQFADGAVLHSDLTVFALGGQSWKVTGSEGEWLNQFKKKGVKTVPFQSSNCALKIDWDTSFLKQNEGKPFKNIATHCAGKTQFGEVVVTKFGLEGNGVYALSPEIRHQLNEKEKAQIFMDFKPTLELDTLIQKIKSSKFKSLSDILRNDLKLTKAQVQLLKLHLTKEEFIDIDLVCLKIKNFPLDIRGFAPIDEAISTVGGISLDAINENFELKTLPHHFCIGEMLDYDAPTGGYLLQSCFSMGYKLAQHLNSVYVK